MKNDCRDKVEDLQKKLKEYEFVSFDIYDTLLFRTVQYYWEVFDVVELEFNRIHEASISHFRKRRTEAEKKARVHTKSEDVTLDEIYSYLDCKESIKNDLKKIECEVELNICIPNQKLIKVMNECINNHKTVILISDMYLPREILIQLLKKMGISGFNQVFLSSEVGFTKRTGNLFSFVLNELSIDGNELIHIGNDVNTDYKPAIQKGIHAYLLEKTEFNCLYWKKRNAKVGLNHLVQCTYTDNLEMEEMTSEFQIGYRIIGPFLTQFGMWLHDVNKLHKFDKIVFLAREGYFPYLIYKKMYPEENICYLRINRNTLKLPMLDLKPTIQTFIELLKEKEEYTIEEIVDIFCVDESISLNDIIKKNGYAKNSRILRSSMENDRRFLTFFEECVSRCRPIMKEQRKMLTDYLKQANIEEGDKVALVNNSMLGSGQFYLQNLLPNIKFWGVHYILKKYGKKRIDSKCSVWFDKGCSQYEKTIFYKNALTFEHLLFESEGTSLNYLYNDFRVEVRCKKRKCEIENDNILKQVELGAEAFRKRYMEVYPLRIGSNDCLALINTFLTFPTIEDAKTVGRLYDDSRKLVEYNSADKTGKTSDLFHEIWRFGSLIINEKRAFIRIYIILLHLKLVLFGRMFV